MIMFGKLLGHIQEDQTVTLHYEKQDVILHVLTPEIINVFVPFAHPDHRSKAIEGDKEQPVLMTLTKGTDCLILKTDSVTLKIYDDFHLDF